MGLNFEEVLLALRSQAVFGSLHGFHRIFRARNYRWRVLWVAIMAVFVSCCCYNLALLYHEHFVKHPVVTSMRYIRRHHIPFPDVYICPVLPYQSLVEEQIAPSVLKFLSMLLLATYNPLYEPFRNYLAHNLTFAFNNYPGFNKHWAKLFTNDSHSQQLGTFVFLYRFSSYLFSGFIFSWR